MKLAIIDLDGVVADSTERFKRAEEARRAYVDAHKVGNAVLREYGSPSVNDIYWQAAFNPEMVVFDLLIPGTLNTLDLLDKRGYNIVFLTSRPETMRKATYEWLMDMDIYDWSMSDIPGTRLIMKSPAFQFTKTTVWKTGVVQMLATLLDVSEVLFVDDESANTTMLAETWQEEWGDLRTWSSLKLAFVQGDEE